MMARFMVIIYDATELSRAWGIASTVKAAHEEARDQAAAYNAAHPDNFIDAAKDYRVHVIEAPAVQ